VIVVGIELAEDTAASRLMVEWLVETEGGWDRARADGSMECWANGPPRSGNR
jgi:hypothetical protein